MKNAASFHLQTTVLELFKAIFGRRDFRNFFFFFPNLLVYLVSTKTSSTFTPIKVIFILLTMESLMGSGG